MERTQKTQDSNSSSSNVAGIKKEKKRNHEACTLTFEDERFPALLPPHLTNCFLLRRRRHRQMHLPRFTLPFQTNPMRIPLPCGCKKKPNASINYPQER
jgi:hypothetical protein